MGMVMGMAVFMQMLMIVGVFMRMGVLVIMLVGMRMTIVGMLVGVGMGMLVVVLATGNVIVINVHGYFSFYSVTSSASTNRLVTWMGMGRRLSFAARNTHSSISWQQAFSILTTVTLAISL